MINDSNQTISKENILYNKILLLSRNKLFYTDFNLSDTFINRVHLIFFHISFLFIKIKQNKLDSSYKSFYQKMFDLIFSKIEENMREIGYGDVTINKSMKSLVKTFYNILLNCENYSQKSLKSKKSFLLNYFEENKVKKHSIDSFLVEYFDKYEAFCFDLSDDSVLKGDLKFNFK
tara:strand:+ start:1349 stop:1873 length:525 start_codon:yes stop_codon:yes gene_type:complete